MGKPPFVPRASILAVVLLVLSACAPASPTAAPAKPAATTAPPKAEAKPAPTAAPAKPAATAPAAKPAPKPTEKPAAKPAAKAETKPAAKAETKPAAKAAFDEKAVADFYRGKTVRMIVGLAPGGGYDTYTRAIAKYFGKHIPGNPTVIVENMDGAGSLIATNHVYNAAPKDGTAIVHFLGTIVSQALFGAPGIEFDGTKFQYIGAPTGDSAIIIVHSRTGIKKLEDMIGPNAKEVAFGGVAPGSLTDDSPKLVRDVLGAKIRIVSGYRGTAPVRAAIEQGEVDGFANSWESTKVTNFEDVQNGNWIIPLQLLEQRHRDLPNVPAIPEVVTNAEDRQLLTFGVSPFVFARPYALAPEVPKDRVEALRAALAATLEDKDFLADAERAKLTISPKSGQELQKMIQDYLGMPTGVKEKLQKILTEA